MKPVLYAKKMTSKRKMLPIHVHVGLGQCLIMQSFTDTYYKYNKLPFMYNMNNVGCSFCKIFFKSLPCKMNQENKCDIGRQLQDSLQCPASKSPLNYLGENIQIIILAEILLSKSNFTGKLNICVKHEKNSLQNVSK